MSKKYKNPPLSTKKIIGIVGRYCCEEWGWGGKEVWRSQRSQVGSRPHCWPIIIIIVGVTIMMMIIIVIILVIVVILIIVVTTIIISRCGGVTGLTKWHSAGAHVKRESRSRLWLENSDKQRCQLKSSTTTLTILKPLLKSQTPVC